jgi:hypothetical protein
MNKGRKKTMINFEKNPNAKKAMSALMNLHNALKNCGVNSELVVDNDNNIISVRSDVWNCVDGSDVLVEVYSAEFEGWEINSYAEPENDRKAFEAELKAFLAEGKE